MQVIDIATALRRIAEPYSEGGKDNTFSIRFVKKDGTIRQVSHAQRAQDLPEMPKSGGALPYSLRDTHTILVYEIGNPRPMTVKIPTIIQIKKCRIRH